MKTQEFVTSLRAHNDTPVIFDYGGARVPAGYHVTEVKAVSYQTMDCGGKSDAWTETIVQLWNPDATDKKEFMSAKKFLNIFDRAASGVPVTTTSELRLEYGNETMPAINYHVGNISLEDGKLVIKLEPPKVQCKARNRSAEASVDTASACCTPSQNLGISSTARAERGISVETAKTGTGCC
jgi:Family of unknown function (DUF6428)